MVYLYNNYIPNDVSIEKGLTFVYGIGKSRAITICDSLGLNKSLKIGNLSEANLDRITNFLSFTYYTDNDLKRTIRNDIQKLISIRCYRGIRHVSRLPVRGQRTRTNSRIVRQMKVK